MAQGGQEKGRKRAGTDKGNRPALDKREMESRPALDGGANAGPHFRNGPVNGEASASVAAESVAGCGGEESNGEASLEVADEIGAASFRVHEQDTVEDVLGDDKLIERDGLVIE